MKFHHGQGYKGTEVIPIYIESSRPHSPDSMVDGANMGPIWGRQDPGGPHVGPMNFAIWVPCVYVLIPGALVKPEKVIGRELMTWEGEIAQVGLRRAAVRFEWYFD